MSVDTNADYVSWSVKNGEKRSEEITSENHAFYIGKLILHTRSEKFRRLLGWGKVNEPIYNEEFIVGALEYLFSNLREGEKAQFVVAPSLSELFNGQERMERALTKEEEIDFIKKTSKRYFGKRSLSDLEVIDFETIPHNQRLFEELRSNIGPDGHIDIESVFKEHYLLSENSDALDIARFLYQAKESNENLAGVFFGMIPAEIKDEIKEMDPDSEEYHKLKNHHSCYGLAEVSCRLAEILRGRTIHGGVERQEKYDEVIERIISGKKGKYKNMKELELLFKLFEGRNFETIHLKTAENPYKLKKERLIARSRLAIYSALIVSILASSFSAGMMFERDQENKEEARIHDLVKEELKGVGIYGPDRWMGEYSDEGKVGVYDAILYEVENDLTLRYGIEKEAIPNFESFLKQFIIDNKKLLHVSQSNHYVRHDIADAFVAKNPIYFNQKEPYSAFRLHLNLFKEIINAGEKDVVLWERTSYGGVVPPTKPQEATGEISDRDLEDIGVFKAGNRFETEYHYFIYHNPYTKKDQLLVKDKDSSLYSSAKAKEGAYHIIYSIQRADMIPLYPFSFEVSDLINLGSMDYYREGDNISCRDIVVSEKESELYDTYSISSSFGDFKYEFVINYDLDEPSLSSVKCLLARKPGEKEFTAKTAIEMVGKYEKLRDVWYGLYTGNDLKVLDLAK